MMVSKRGFFRGALSGLAVMLHGVRPSLAEETSWAGSGNEGSVCTLESNGVTIDVCNLELTIRTRKDESGRLARYGVMRGNGIVLTATVDGLNPTLPDVVQRYPEMFPHARPEDYSGQAIVRRLSHGSAPIVLRLDGAPMRFPAIADREFSCARVAGDNEKYWFGFRAEFSMDGPA